MLLRSKSALAGWIEDRLGSEGSPEIADRMAEYLADVLWDEIGYMVPTSRQFKDALAAAVED
jgi:hypothetical protein